MQYVTFGMAINLNMRCIEMTDKVVESITNPEINLNMRCIEIKEVENVVFRYFDKP